MEYLDEQSRYETGCLPRELDIALAIAAMQKLEIDNPDILE